MRRGKLAGWMGWIAVVSALAGGLGYRMLSADDRSLFLPGETTDAHHQIELACESCHRSPFGGTAVLQNACMDCHGAELERADNAHPKSKFTDPRNAARVAVLDARYCVTCHREHVPARTRPMAVTEPKDFCVHCHRDIAKDRPSHAGLGFDTCASSGCHNFHDDRALYEDFLVEHGHDTTPAKRLNPALTPALAAKGEGDALSAADRDAPPDKVTDTVLREWSETGHARAGVNCTDCHGSGARWTDHPSRESCAQCHEPEEQGFLSGKHGMRLAAGLSPMTPARARLPMKSDALDRELTCNSCHPAHRFDIRHAAVDGCLGCHDDRHSRAFKGSPHHDLWLAEVSGRGQPDSGVSCATCHMPRRVRLRRGTPVTRVEHNQNANLRPNEKMIRGVCMSCHTLRFSIDALADPGLIRNNFSAKPSRHVKSIDMALEREQAHDDKQR